MLSNQIAGFLNFNISKTVGFLNWTFLSVCTHLSKLHTDDVILLRHGQASPKRILKLSDLKNKKTYKVDFVHVASYQLKLSMNYVSLGECGHICPGKPKEVFKILSQKQMEV